jgi:hypothetical protein
MPEPQVAQISIGMVQDFFVTTSFHDFGRAIFLDT